MPRETYACVVKRRTVMHAVGWERRRGDGETPHCGESREGFVECGGVGRGRAVFGGGPGRVEKERVIFMPVGWDRGTGSGARGGAGRRVLVLSLPLCSPRYVLAAF